jgi:hypothetical protein
MPGLGSRVSSVEDARKFGSVTVNLSRSSLSLVSHRGGSEIDEKNVTKFDAKVFNDRIASEVLKGALHTQNELYFKAPV